MDDKQITIRMPKRYLKKWLRALRGSPDNGYEQCKGVMYSPHKKTFCFLGVLQHAITGGVEHDALGYPLAFPRPRWISEHGISFPAQEYRPWYLPTLGAVGWYANDKLGKTFSELADAIEACTEGY